MMRTALNPIDIGQGGPTCASARAWSISPDHVCCRYRLAAFRAALGAGRAIAGLFGLAARWWPARVWPPTATAPMPCILQRRLLPAGSSALCAARPDRLIFDFDDAVFLRDSYAPKGLHSAAAAAPLRRHRAAADAVVAGNDSSPTQAARWAGAERVHVIPTCVDPAAIRWPSTRTGDGVATGLGRLVQHLARLGDRSQPLLEEVGRSGARAALKLICDRFLGLQHLPVVACPWREATEAAEIAAADIGISWVPDDTWSRGKCGAEGAAIHGRRAAGGRQPGRRPARDGAPRRDRLPGRHAAASGSRRSADWPANPDLRRRMGRAGRQRVEAAIQRGAAGAESLRWPRAMEALRERQACRPGCGDGRRRSAD